MVLDVPDDERPNTKTHELFLPDRPGTPLPIDTRVLEEFHGLADLRGDTKTPGLDKDDRLPWASRGNPGRANHPYRIEPGDLVYFDVDNTGKVNEIALTSIWRKGVRDGGYGVATAHAFFDAQHRELLPFNRTRRRLTLAERVFGIVEERLAIIGDDDPTDNGLDGLSGRVRVANARFHHAAERSAYLPECTLRTLVSPKPPSPAMYFDPVGSKAVTRATLEPKKHRPKGRKFYLHQDPIGEPWKLPPGQSADSYNAKVCPQQIGNVFYFHVDFDNLSDEELGLLVYAMQPSPTFMHKLGMGKAIGLGSVRIEPLGLFSIDRATRYSAAGFSGARYHEAVVGDADDGWSGFYLDEADTNPRSAEWISARRDKFVTWYPDANTSTGQIGRAIAWLGALPTPSGKPVHWPTTVGQSADGGEHFRWFVINEQKKRHVQPAGQPLKSLPADDVRLRYNPAYQD